MHSKLLARQGKPTHSLFLPVCILKAWVLRKCWMEAGMDWRHCPHHQFASHSITLQRQQGHAFKLSSDTKEDKLSMSKLGFGNKRRRHWVSTSRQPGLEKYKHEHIAFSYFWNSIYLPVYVCSAPYNCLIVFIPCWRSMYDDIYARTKTHKLPNRTLIYYFHQFFSWKENNLTIPPISEMNRIIGLQNNRTWTTQFRSKFFKVCSTYIIYDWTNEHTTPLSCTLPTFDQADKEITICNHACLVII